MREHLEGSFADVSSRKRSWAGGGVGDAPSGAGAPPPPAALPCLNSHNSITHLSNSHKRTAFALTENVKLLAEKFGLERLGFLTLTFRDHVTDIKEAQRRLNSWRTNVLSKRYDATICVVERMKSGRIHFHLLVALTEDIRTGFDFEAVKNDDYRTANSFLRSEWGFLRTSAKAYGFGRTELLPVKSTAEGIAKYVGKYIAKHIGERRPDDKGARLVRYTVGARQVTTNFAWVSERATQWRERVGEVAEAVGAKDLEDIKGTLGTRWAYHMRGDITDPAPLNWRMGLMNVALVHGGDVPRARLNGPDGLPLSGVTLSSLDDYLETGEWLMADETAMRIDVKRGLAMAGQGVGTVYECDPF